MIIKDGVLYGTGLTIAGGVAIYLGGIWWGLPFFLLAGFCLYFFRDPDRTIPDGPVAVSPADGKVAEVSRLEHDEFIGGPALRIGIFLSIFNVHVNRSPADGVCCCVDGCCPPWAAAMPASNTSGSKAPTLPSSSSRDFHSPAPAMIGA